MYPAAGMGSAVPAWTITDVIKKYPAAFSAKKGKKAMTGLSAISSRTSANNL